MPPARARRWRAVGCMRLLGARPPHLGPFSPAPSVSRQRVTVVEKVGQLAEKVGHLVGRVGQPSSRKWPTLVERVCQPWSRNWTNLSQQVAPIGSGDFALRGCAACRHLVTSGRSAPAAGRDSSLFPPWSGRSPLVKKVVDPRRESGSPSSERRFTVVERVVHARRASGSLSSRSGRLRPESGSLSSKTWFTFVENFVHPGRKVVHPHREGGVPSSRTWFTFVQESRSPSSRTWLTKRTRPPGGITALVGGAGAPNGSRLHPPPRQAPRPRHVA